MVTYAQHIAKTKVQPSVNPTLANKQLSRIVNDNWLLDKEFTENEKNVDINQLLYVHLQRHAI